MPRKKAKEVEASIEETQPVEEETPEAEEKPEVPAEEVPKTDEPEEAAEVGETPEVTTEEAAEEIEEAPVKEETPEEVPKAELESPVIARKVPVGSLPITAKFDYRGQLYQKRDSTAAVVSGLNLKETQRAQQMVWKAFPPDTLVIPK